ncbi:MAG: ABC transporter permease [Rubellimicrobium sp.]|nr:ABC transporter permease [Rubellimicrobium sp.]
MSAETTSPPAPHLAKRSARRRRAFQLGEFRGLTLWVGAVLVFLYFPICVLVIYSFNESRFAMNWTGFSTDWYGRALANRAARTAALNSVIVATCATAMATVIATAAALVLARRNQFRGKTAAIGLMSLPILVPEIVTAIATLIFFSTLGIRLGLGNLIIAHTVFSIPFAFMPIRARLQGMDMSLEAAARDLYATPWQSFRLVTLPLLAPGIMAGAMLAFVISLDDFIISLMVADAGSTTLPVYIFSMIRFGITPEINAISTMLFAASVSLVTVYWLLSRPRR